MENEVIYPDSVEDIIDIWADTLHETDSTLEKKYLKKAVRLEIGNTMFQRWKNGDDLVLTESEAHNCIIEIYTRYSLIKMIDIGVLDSIDNADEDEIYFLTEHGKRIIKELKES